jgi:hypothetical protein
MRGSPLRSDTKHDFLMSITEIRRVKAKAQVLVLVEQGASLTSEAKGGNYQNLHQLINNPDRLLQVDDDLIADSSQ